MYIYQEMLSLGFLFGFVVFSWRICSPLQVDIRWEDIVEQEEGSKVDMFEMDLDDDPETNGEEGMLAASPPQNEASPESLPYSRVWGFRVLGF